MSETQSIDVSKDRIKLPFNFDVKKMIQEFEILKQKHLPQYEYYDTIPLRSPAHLVEPKYSFSSSSRRLCRWILDRLA